MMDIREFLEARLAEDEAIARAAADFGERWRFADDIFPSDDSRHPGAIIAGSYGCGIPDQYGNHVVRHDPARVLRDVEAGRLLLATMDAFEHLDCPDPWYSCPLSPDGCADEDVVGCSCWVEPRRKRLLQVLVLTYADHPDYDPSWSPVGGNAVG